VAANEILFLIVSVFDDDSSKKNFGGAISCTLNLANVYEGKYEGIIRAFIDKYYANNTRRLVIPIILGTVYDKNYGIFIDTNSSLKMRTYHSEANFYSNVFFVEISNVSPMSNLELNFVIEYDEFKVMLRKFWGFSTILLCLSSFFQLLG
jgi:predicted outer membrane repeat protein